MAKKTWTFDLDGQQHTILLEHGTITGKRVIYIDGELREKCQHFNDTGSMHPFQMGEHRLVVVIKTEGFAFRYDLLIDDVSHNPEKVIIAQDPTGLTLAYQWHNSAYILVACIMLIWTGFVVAIFVGTFLPSLSRASGPRFLFVSFPLVMLLVGIGLLYWSLAKVINRTIIHVTRSEITLEHKPLPWPGRRTIQVMDIRQLYCESYQRGSSPEGATVTVTLYRLCAATQEGNKITLMSGLENCRDVEFIEHEIENWLHLPQLASRPAL